MKWIKLHTDEWLNSTMRFTLNHKQRAIWADFLALGGKSRVPGIICAGEENGKLIGLPPARIAGIVDIAPDELSEILKVFESQERITTEEENGRLIIRLCNWSKYQSEYDRQKKYRQPSKRVTGESDVKLHVKLQNATAKSDSLEVEGEVEVEGDKKRKNPAAKPTPSADPRFGPFLEFAKGSFEAKHKRPPTWDCFGKDGAALAAFLRRAPHVTLEVWQIHILNFFDSTEAFTVKQGGSLAYFVSRFDTFSAGPILEGGSNGKLVSFAEQRSQKNSAAIQRVLGCAEEASGDIRRALPPTHN